MAVARSCSLSFDAVHCSTGGILNDLFFARSQMGMSLAFHIIFAVIGMAMPLLMAVSEGCYLWTKKPIFLELSKRWAAGTTILFAVGAVSGTVLSFELGLLWPKFMQYSGGIIGMPFSLEGFAFFTEAIFLGIYLYGWNRVSPVLHWLAGIVVAVSGVLSAVFVDVSKLLDECADRVRRCQWAAGQHQSDRSNVESGVAPRNHPHGAGGVRGYGVFGYRNPRVLSPARSTKRLSPWFL
jgi:hypothetical protein